MDEKIKDIKTEINKKIKQIKENEMYPAYCLNGQVSGLEQALEIIEEVIE